MNGDPLLFILSGLIMVQRLSRLIVGYSSLLHSSMPLVAYSVVIISAGVVNIYFLVVIGFDGVIWLLVD